MPEWVDEHRPETNILRLIYQGRFLHGSVTLSSEYQWSDIVRLTHADIARLYTDKGCRTGLIDN